MLLLSIPCFSYVPSTCLIRRANHVRASTPRRMPESPVDGEEARLRLLVEKLSHVLPDVQLRALRNLRQKFSAGLMSPEFLAHEAGLHKALVGLAAGATRESIRGEALLFVADIFSKPGLSSCKAG